MADFNKVGLDIIFTELYPNLRNLIGNIATWLDGTIDSNIVDKAKKWSAGNRRFEQYNEGTSSWGPLLDKNNDTIPYEIRVAEANHAEHADDADEATNADHADTADLATNADNLGGQPPSHYRAAGDLVTVAEGGTGQVTVSGVQTAFDILRKNQNGVDIPDKASFFTTIAAAVKGAAARVALGFGTAVLHNAGTGSNDLTTNSRVSQIAASTVGTPSYTTTTTTIPARTVRNIGAPSGYRFLYYSAGRVHTGIASNGTYISFNNTGNSSMPVSVIWAKNV
jgi:hypothetical protein